MAVRLSLLLLLLLLAVAGASTDSDVLRGFLSDPGHTVPGDPSLIPGVTYDAGGAATRIALPAAGLTGSLSAAIGRLPALRELSLPDNRLSGVLPRELARCRALRILDLRSNRLSGDVPRELASLTNLRSLDLSSNLLTGDLCFLRRFPYLENLSLAGNLFSGLIPRSLNSFPKLRHLDLSDNPNLVASDDSLRRRSLLPSRYISSPRVPPNLIRQATILQEKIILRHRHVCIITRTSAGISCVMGSLVSLSAQCPA